MSSAQQPGAAFAGRSIQFGVGNTLCCRGSGVATVYSQSLETTSSEIHLIHITKAYQTGWKRRHVALDNTSLWIRRGETMSVVGPTGCGKSTMLRVIAG